MRRINDWLMGLPPVQRAGTVLGFFGISVGGGFAAYFNNWPLLITIGVGLLLVVVAFILWKLFTKKSDKELTSGLEQWGKQAPRGNEKQIADTLQLQSVFGEGLLQIRDALKAHKKDLYHIPWYLVVGPPGSGKTEMVRRSGISFFVDNMNKGAGGTLSMDWWPSEGGILVDSAGRLFTDGGDEWRTLLQLLRKSRPRCPVNGVVLAIGADGLLRGSEEELARTLLPTSKRLAEIQKELQVRLPVYVIITKGDLIPGFKEFFDHVEGPEQQAQMLGWSDEVPLEQEHRFRPDQIDALLARMVERIRKRRWALLQDLGRGEPPPGTPRINYMDTLYELPETLEHQVMPRLKRYLEVIFGQSQGVLANRPAFVRGVYFTSAMQEGGALDAFMAQTMGVPVEKVPADGRRWEKDRAVFIRGVLSRKVFPEKGLVTPALDVGREVVRRQMYLFGSVAAGILFLGGLMVWAGVTLSRTVNQPARDWRALAKSYEDLRKEKTNIITQPEKVAELLGKSNEAANRRLGLTFPFSIFSRDMASDERMRAHRVIVDTLALQPLVTEARSRLQKPEYWVPDRRSTSLQSVVELCKMATYNAGKAPASEKVLVPPSLIDLYSLSAGTTLSQANEAQVTDAGKTAYGTARVGRSEGAADWNVWPPQFARSDAKALEADADAAVGVWADQFKKESREVFDGARKFASTDLDNYDKRSTGVANYLKAVGEADSSTKFSEAANNFQVSWAALSRDRESLKEFLAGLHVKPGEAPISRVREAIGERKSRARTESQAILGAFPTDSQGDARKRAKAVEPDILQAADDCDKGVSTHLDRLKAWLDADTTGKGTWKFDAKASTYASLNDAISKATQESFGALTSGSSLQEVESQITKAFASLATDKESLSTQLKSESEADFPIVNLHKYRSERLRTTILNWLLQRVDSTDSSGRESLPALVEKGADRNWLNNLTSDLPRDLQGKTDWGTHFARTTDIQPKFEPTAASALAKIIKAVRDSKPTTFAGDPSGSDITTLEKAWTSYAEDFTAAWKGFAEPAFDPSLLPQSSAEESWSALRGLLTPGKQKDVRSLARAHYAILDKVAARCPDMPGVDAAKFKSFASWADEPPADAAALSPYQRPLAFLGQMAEQSQCDDVEEARAAFASALSSQPPIPGCGEVFDFSKVSSTAPLYWRGVVLEVLRRMAQQADDKFVAMRDDFVKAVSTEGPPTPQQAQEVAESWERLSDLKARDIYYSTDEASTLQRRIRGQNYVTKAWIDWAGGVNVTADDLLKLKDSNWLINLPPAGAKLKPVPNGVSIATGRQWVGARLVVDNKPNAQGFTRENGEFAPATNAASVSAFGRSITLRLRDSESPQARTADCKLGETDKWSVLPALLQSKTESTFNVREGWIDFPVYVTASDGTTNAFFISVKCADSSIQLQDLMNRLPFPKPPASPDTK